MFLGKIGEVDEVYLNGFKIGQTGNPPPKYINMMNTERVYYLPSYLIKKVNTLEIRVYTKYVVNKGLKQSVIKFGPYNVLSSRSDFESNVLNAIRLVTPLLGFFVLSLGIAWLFIQRLFLIDHIILIFMGIAYFITLIRLD